MLGNRNKETDSHSLFGGRQNHIAGKLPDDLGGKAELTVREPPKREGSYEPSSQGRFIRNL